MLLLPTTTILDAGGISIEIRPFARLAPVPPLTENVRTRVEALSLKIEK